MFMNCSKGLVDAMDCRPTNGPGLERVDAGNPRAWVRALEGAASACPSCRRAARGIRAFGPAIGGVSWAPSPGARPGSRTASSRRLGGGGRGACAGDLRPGQRAGVGSAAAAARGAARGPVGARRAAARRRPEGRRGRGRGSGRSTRRTCPTAIAEVTSATLELARDASAPAARVGREGRHSTGAPGDLPRSIVGGPRRPHSGRPTSFRGSGTG